MGQTGVARLHRAAAVLAFDREIVRYDVLANWWAEVVKGTPVRLYAGVALYKVGTPAASEPAGPSMAASPS